MLSKKQVADALLHTSNATLHMDTISKKQHHFFSIQITTPCQHLSTGRVKTVSGDTHTQLDITKDFFHEMAVLIDNSSMDHSSNEYKLLFNIKNTMANRVPTSRSWVEQLQIWREDVLNMSRIHRLVPRVHFCHLHNQQCLLWYYKHFLLGLAERTKVGLTLW